MADYHVGSHTHALSLLLSGVTRSGKTPVPTCTEFQGSPVELAVECMCFIAKCAKGIPGVSFVGHGNNRLLQI